MLKNIQKQLLIKYPLLWNLKIVPITLLLLVFHFIFFFLGIYNSSINFNETGRNYSNDSEGIIIFFSFLISILLLIIWLVNYFKNNSFKTYYPKKNSSLFKEWLLILIICFLLSTFWASYMLGNTIRTRLYFSEKEAQKRCQIISEASLFYKGSFQQAATHEVRFNDTLKNVALDYYLFKGKQYSLNSLINKNIQSSNFFEGNQDSLTKRKIKTWLVNNQKDSVRVLLKKYLAIANEHHLKANIDENKWLALVYHYPNFEEHNIVGTQEKDYQGDYVYAGEAATSAINVEQETNGLPIDTLNQYIDYVGKEKFVFNKNYVPADALYFNYDKIAASWTNPIIDYNLALVMLYVALGLSILIFSFRVTSGKSWLITLVSLGIFNIVLGISSAISSTEFVYIIGILLLTIAVFIYFIMIIARRKGKSISAITLNGLLWLMPTFIPVTYLLIQQSFRKMSNYYDYSYNYNIHDEYYKWYQLLEDYAFLMFIINIVFIVIMMLFFSYKIKKWKGVAEG